jgi:hypothetical protein
VARIKETLATRVGDRSARGNLDPVPGFGSETAVTLIRKALVKCLDEAPSPATAEFKFISDPKLKENLRIDIGAINRALSNGEWKAATVLAGAAVEALLLWALQQQKPADLAKAPRTAPKLPGKPLDEWHLPDYIEAADRLRIITADAAIQARLAKDFRNLIHPGRAQRLGQKCDMATALSAVVGVQHVLRDLTP